MTDSEKCGDPHPHGWQPCVLPKGHKGLHSLTPADDGLSDEQGPGDNDPNVAD